MTRHEDMLNREWRPVVGYEGQYEVSSCGIVRGVDRVLSHGHRWKGRVLRQKRIGAGYLAVDLCKDSKYTTKLIHRMVLEAFVGPCPEGRQGCHGDGDKTNNCVANLRWDTPLGNAADRHEHGTAVYGERVGTRKLSEADVRKILSLQPTTRRERCQLAKQFGVSHSLIYSIVRGWVWKHLHARR